MTGKQRKGSVLIAIVIIVNMLLLGIIPTLAEDQPKEGDIIAQYDFDDGTTQGWVSRGTAWLEPTTEKAYSGTHSLLTTGRTENWNGPSLNMLGQLQKGAVYHVSAFVKLGEEPDAERSVKITMEETPAAEEGSTGWKTVGSKNISDTVWTEITGSYTSNMEMSAQILYVESSGDTDSILIDDITITMTSPPLAPNMIDEEVPSLKEFFRDSFEIGAAIEPQQILAYNNDALLKKHYNSLVAENVMKMDAIQPTEGNFNWLNADKIVQYAEDNGLSLRFHTLQWHSQVPNWFFLDKDGEEMTDEIDPLRRKENKALLLERLESHIRAIIQRYGEKVDSWDVVNEVIEPGDGNPDGLRNNKWYLITGKDYIKTAFQVAKDELDKVGGTGKLYINDYNTHNPVKRDFIYDLVQELLDEGIPVDGVGHQTHINISQPSVKLIVDSIEKFGSLGLDNQITELDVSLYDDSSVYNRYEEIPEELFIKQGYRYKELFEGLDTVKDYISSVVFWGIADDHTWLNNREIKRIDGPFAFNRQQLVKLSFWGMVDPSQLPMQTKEMDIPAGMVYIDGKSEFQWDILKGIELSFGGDTASFKTLWDRNTLFILAEVSDDTMNNMDQVEIFIDENNAKTAYYEEDDVCYTLWRDGRTVEGVNYKVTEQSGGYLVEAAVHIKKRAIIDGQIGFDIRFHDKDTSTVVSWNDRLHSQDNSTAGFGTATWVNAFKVVDSLYGTPVIDGELDEVWKDTPEINTGTWVTGKSGATAKVKTLWDKERLYVYAKVTDILLSKESENAWEQDSIEVFIDQNNGKTQEYEDDDAQYRVNFENMQSFGTGASEDKITSAAKIVEDGYIVEMAIELDAVSPEKGLFMGFDFQVNNDENGDGTRDSVITWNDETGQSYQNTSKLGILRFTKDEGLVFRDIYNVAWAQNQIEFLASKGVLRGVSEKAFMPMEDITRSDFLYFLINTLGLTADTEDNFDDIEKEAYYYEAVATAKKLGITKGVGNNLYQPLREITRQDMMTLVVRALKAAGKQPDSCDISVIEGFIDFSLVADYAVDSMAMLVNKGYIQGSGNRLNPLNNLTRAEAAVLLYRVYTE